MSVVNQMLNRLEQRGVSTASGQTMVRVVPPVRRKSAMLLLMPGLVLAIGFAVWQWMLPRKPDVAATSVAQYQPAVIAAVSPASAVIAGESQEQPQVVEVLVPVSRLSFELGLTPLSSSQQELKNNVAPDRVEELAENPVASIRLHGSKRATPGEGAPPAGSISKPNLLPSKIVNSDTNNAVQSARDVSPMKQVSPAQHADAEFRKAVALMQQGRIADALAGYEAALRLDAGLDAARQALVALLLEDKRGTEAERVLQEGLKVKPEHSGFAMLLARLQVERGAVEQATATLEKALPYAGQQAGYQAFFAALLQRLNRHQEAITHYQIALQLVPDNGIWLMGYGISLQAVQRIDDARDAFKRALDAKTLSPELQAFVQQKLKEL
ncbi:MAG TPA: tetratricopeptide repeat protein [Gallionella sp.]|nr:tetratricopeptide repeat protein [Gallionella sp.]